MGYALQIYQLSGMRVDVPPGWLHQVINLRSTIKAAYDYVRWHQLPTIMLGNSILSRHARNLYPGADYMDVFNCIISQVSTMK